MILKRLINIAINECRYSDHKQRMSAIIFGKNKIISKGFNTSQKSLRHFLAKFQRWKGSVHAEVDAIIKAKRDLKNMSILIIRVNKNNQLRYSRPCEHCRMYLEYVGIKKIYFINKEEKIEILKEVLDAKSNQRI